MSDLERDARGRQMLAASHLMPLELLPAAVTEHAAAAGFSRVLIYLGDLQRDLLRLLTGVAFGEVDGGDFTMCALARWFVLHRCHGVHQGGAHVGALSGMRPGLAGSDSPVIAAGIIGATVMPHVISSNPRSASCRAAPLERQGSAR
ncbi:hypothetical protein [Streptomyces bauhiniae]|uniref:hypothetical protein n=1 Tax=Streptomyces bauhiniae TaxID=2340725 RepID=UPI003658B7AE